MLETLPDAHRLLVRASKTNRNWSEVNLFLCEVRDKALSVFDFSVYTDACRAIVNGQISEDQAWKIAIFAADNGINTD